MHLLPIVRLAQAERFADGVAVLVQQVFHFNHGSPAFRQGIQAVAQGAVQLLVLIVFLEDILIEEQEGVEEYTKLLRNSEGSAAGMKSQGKTA